MSINTVTLMGRLTYNPELRVTPQGVFVIRFAVACERRFNREQTDFIDCVAWKQTAEFISKYFQKGSMIAVEGSIQTNDYTDKNGNKRKSVEVVANNVSFCGGKSEGGNNSRPSVDITPSDNSDFEEIIDDDDLPF